MSPSSQPITNKDKPPNGRTIYNPEIKTIASKEISKKKEAMLNPLLNDQSL